MALAHSAGDYCETLRKRIAAAKQLTDALYSWMTVDLEAQLSSMGAIQDDPAERLVYVQTNLESARERLRSAEEAVGKMKKIQPETCGIFELTLVAPVREEVEQLEKALSELTQKMQAA
jgi:hypothetical protein